MKRFTLLVLSLALVSANLCAEIGKGALPLAPIHQGEGQLGLALLPYNMTVYTYKPANFKKTNGMLIVFHGHGRDAHEYLEHAKGLADKHGVLLIVPDFSDKEFPGKIYNDGGVIIDGKVQKQENWVFTVVPHLIEAIRRKEGDEQMPYYLLGHSAGGQFLERLMAFVSLHPIRAVAANPGSHMIPDRDFKFPYGFGGIPEFLGGDPEIKAYLARPLTLYLGTADTDPKDPELDQSATAEKEGAYRLARGTFCYETGKKIAAAKGWPFGWRLAHAPGVGHNATQMFAAPECEKALFGSE